MEIQKFEYLENEKSFLDEIKIVFHTFLKGYHLVRNKNMIKYSENKPLRTPFLQITHKLLLLSLITFDSF